MEPSTREEFQYPIPLGVFFCVIVLTIGALMKEVTKKIPIPYPAAMFMLGLLIGGHIENI